MGTRLIALGGILLAGAGVTAFVTGTSSFDDHTERDQHGEIVEPGGLGAFRVEIGDCVNLPDELTESIDDELAEVIAVDGIPCVDPHDAQAYDTFDITDLTTYSIVAAERRAEQGCVDRWANAIGTNFWVDHELTIYYFIPSSATWTLLRDRAVVCFVTSLDGSPLVGSRLVEDRG